MGRQGSRGTPTWPIGWNHRVVQKHLHVAAGHVVRYVSRYWFIQCPNGDCNGIATVARCLSLRDVVDDLTAHLRSCR